MTTARRTGGTAPARYRILRKGRGTGRSTSGWAVIASHLYGSVDLFRTQQNGGLYVYLAARGDKQSDPGRGRVVRQVNDCNHIGFTERVVERVELSADAGTRLFDGGSTG